MAWHTADGFLGLTEREAQAWAGALGCAFRDQTRPRWITHDDRSDRINLSFSEDGRPVWAEIG